MRKLIVERLQKLHGVEVGEELVKKASQKLHYGVSMGSATGLAFFREGEYDCRDVLCPRSDSEAFFPAVSRIFNTGDVFSVLGKDMFLFVAT